MAEYARFCRILGDKMGVKKLVYNNFVMIDNAQWFWCRNYNALFKRDCVSGKAEKIGKYVESENSAYSRVVLFKNKIIALPFAAEQIGIYDVNVSEFRYVDIGIPNVELEKGHLKKFYGLVVHNQTLYMIGCGIAYVLVFNMETETVEDYIDLNSYMKKDKKTDSSAYMSEAILYNDKILIPLVYDNFILEVDLNNYNVVKRKVDKSGKGFSTICKVNNQIWLLPYDEGELIKWDCAAKKIKKYDVSAVFTFVSAQNNFLFATIKNNIVWIFPRVGNAVLSYDIKTEKLSNENVINAYFKSRGKNPGFMAADNCNENIVLLPIEVDECIVFDMHKESIELLINKFPEKEKAEILRMESKGKLRISEREISLQTYIDIVEDANSIKCNANEKNYGLNIFNTLKSGSDY